MSNFQGKGFACSCSTPHFSFALMIGAYMSFTSLIYFSGTPLSRMHQHSSSIGTLLYAFTRSMNTPCRPKSRSPYLYLSCSCLGAKIVSVEDFPFMNPNCFYYSSLYSLNCIVFTFDDTWRKAMMLTDIFLESKLFLKSQDTNDSLRQIRIFAWPLIYQSDPDDPSTICSCVGQLPHVGYAALHSILSKHDIL